MQSLMTIILLLWVKVTFFQKAKAFFCDKLSSDGISDSLVREGSLEISQSLLRAKTKQSMINPIAEYPQNIALYALTVFHPKRVSRNSSTQPQIPNPSADPKAPSNEYQAYMSPRLFSGVIWASVDSSMARKGPISFPLLSMYQLNTLCIFQHHLGLDKYEW
jgi:hypothetical protein